MADYARDALALMDHVGWKSCRVFGVSFGGMVAQELAVTAPSRVERLVLACTSPGGEGGASYPLHELTQLDDETRSEKMVPLLDTRFTPEFLAVNPADRAFASLITNRRIVDRTAERRQGELDQLLARSKHNVADRLSQVTSPTLVAAGRYDGIAPLANSEEIAARVQSAELRVYEGGHAFFVQDQRSIPEILDYLDIS